jgi:hypothetical protein
MSWKTAPRGDLMAKYADLAEALISVALALGWVGI